MEPGIVLRLAVEADADGINAVYNPYVLASTCTFQVTPTTTGERVRWLQRHGPRHPVIVAEDAGRIVAWAALTPYHPREAYAATVEDSIYLAPEVQGRGLGRRMLDDLLARARSIGHRTVVALIASDQPASLVLHRRCGFTDAGLLRNVGRKFDRWLDLVILQNDLTT